MTLAFRTLVLTVAVLAGTMSASVPVQASVPACSPQYSAAHPPALQFSGLPTKVAYGRRITFAAIESGDGESSYDGSGITIQGASPKPENKNGNREGIAEFYLTPKLSQGTNEILTMVYDEEILYGDRCQRAVTQRVQFISGRRPTIRGSTRNGVVSLKIKTYGEDCALMAPGSLVIFVRGPNHGGKLTLSDVCSGHWSRDVQGDEWTFTGRAPFVSSGIADEDAVAEFWLDEPSVSSLHHYRITVLFRGYPFWRISFDERVTIRAH